MLLDRISRDWLPRERGGWTVDFGSGSVVVGEIDHVYRRLLCDWGACLKIFNHDRLWMTILIHTLVGVMVTLPGTSPPTDGGALVAGDKVELPREEGAAGRLRRFAEARCCCKRRWSGVIT